MGLHVSLPQELERLVHQEVETGMYGSASELVREALRDFFDNLAGRELADMNALRDEMQARRQRALSNTSNTGNTENLQDVEKVFTDLSGKHGL
jgi:antitoxin ParD1/3/4